MRAILLGATLLVSVALVFQPVQAQTVTAFKTGERTTGTTKQCYYEFAGREFLSASGSAT